ncbi:hypothetical protein A9Q87_12955 [Flavobacteriales bacterium 34_180_T64]|nr:hypothetical protein A9Q87_12955 [Flavobacteriales bacterium 34_180_T64]
MKERIFSTITILVFAINGVFAQETINTTLTTLINVNVLSLSNGLYYISIPELNSKPLKFIIAH